MTAQYDPRDRWNGFLAAPELDAWSCVAVLDAMAADPDADPYYGYDWHFREDGALVVEDRQWRTEMPEDFRPDVLEPDEDGLYRLGERSWVWMEDEYWTV